MFTEPPIAVPLQWYKPAEQANFLGKHKVGKACWGSKQNMPC